MNTRPDARMCTRASNTGSWRNPSQQDRVHAEAAERHRALDEVVTRLLIHGVLHLVGHDHEEDEEARRMEGEERRVWRAVRG